MRSLLVVLGFLTLAIAFRSARSKILRKLGAITLLFATFLAFYYPTSSIIIGVFGMCLWLFLPWVELLTNVRQLRMPLKNRLQNLETPNASLFPNAEESTWHMEEAGFDHVTTSSWDWSGMKQHFHFYWQPEECASSYICLCEQKEAMFAFIAITSKCANNQLWRTTNFPFSPTLKTSPDIHYNYINCEKACFSQVLKEHRNFLQRSSITRNDLRIPDPANLTEELEQETHRQIQFNLDKKLIKAVGSGQFRYSLKGLFFLWKQFLKDMIRFC